MQYTIKVAKLREKKFNFKILIAIKKIKQTKSSKKTIKFLKIIKFLEIAKLTKFAKVTKKLVKKQNINIS